MSTAGLPKRSLGHDRRGLGLMNLGIGVVLFLLIGMRALQAHRDGDQQLRNDSLWVLVSPLVFGGFGLKLLTSQPSARAATARRRDLEPARRAVEQAQALAAKVEPAPPSQQLEHELQQVRQELEASRRDALAMESQWRDSVRASEARARELEAQLAGLERQREALAVALEQVRQSASAVDPSPALEPLAPALTAQIQQLEQRCAELAAHQQHLRQEHQQALAHLKAQWQRQIEEQLAQFRGQWDGRLAEGQQEIASLEAGWRSQWQALEQVLAGARAEQDAAQRQQRSQAQQLKQQLEQQLHGLNGELQQVRQAHTGLRQQLAQGLTRGEQQQVQLQQRTEAAVGQVEQASTTLRQHLDQLDTDRQGLRRSAHELEQLIARLERSASTSESGISGFDGCYDDACAELGVIPGSPWSAVRATWRQSLLRWHPDQGGDPALWGRRQAAYQLLEAWYAYRQPVGG